MADPSPAAELRHAAKLMRERAEGATPGRWYATEEDVLTDGGSAPHWAGACVANASGADGRHIASWSPPVALAVADWLDAEAEDARIFPLRFPQALVVARAYLAGDPK